jgi:SNF2 family DNA or RNA helicase
LINSSHLISLIIFAHFNLKGRDRGATSAQRASGRAATTRVKRLLRPVLLRRTADALAKALPPRTDIVVFCRLSPAQQELYAQLAAATPHGKNCLEDEEEETENSNSDYHSSNSSSIASRAAKMLAVTYADEGEPAEHNSLSGGAILDHPSLLPSNATGIVTKSGSGGARRSTITAARGSGAAAGGATNRFAMVAGARAREEEAPPLDVSASGKLQVLEALLVSIYNPGLISSSSSNLSATERVVVVSNFTSTLDLISQMAAKHQWPSLRIDGQTPPDQRQGFVDRFNRQQVSNEVVKSAG